MHFLLKLDWYVDITLLGGIKHNTKILIEITMGPGW